MQQRWLLNLFLFFIVLSLGTVALLQWKAEAPPQIASFTDIDKNKVQQIVIKRENKDIILEKQANQWYIRSPLQLAANQFRIDNILQFLTTKHYQQLNSPVDFAELGLDTPTMRLHVDDLELGLGVKSPFNDGRRYILLNNKAYLVVDTISYFLTGDAALFASLSPLGEQPVITGLKLPELHLQLQGHRWALLTSVDDSYDVSADAIQGLVKAWTNLQALSVRSYEPQQADLGLVEIHLQDSQQALQFKIIATDPEFILALPDKQVQYQIASEQVTKLFSLRFKK
jgi:hypothetical protein